MSLAKGIRGAFSFLAQSPTSVPASPRYRLDNDDFEWEDDDFEWEASSCGSSPSFRAACPIKLVFPDKPQSAKASPTRMSL